MDNNPPKRARRPVRREISAGGVVARRGGRGGWEITLLKTKHKRGEVWVLPKGHVELQEGEKVSDAARREVQEEAGINDLSVKEQLGVSRYSFQAETALVKKTVHYFLMTTNQRRLTPQAEEGILAAVWQPIDQAVVRLAYDTDRDIVERARERLLAGGKPARRGSPGRSRPARIHT